MREDGSFLEDYFGRLRTQLTLTPALLGDLARVRDLWLTARDAGGKIIFLGNGGSAGIASHLATDLTKNGGIRATCFNDAALVTCLANDYGFEQWIAHAIRLYADPADVVVAISSSGRSPNILAAVAQARRRELAVVTLSGFAADNPLRQVGDVNLWADSQAYNIVETLHQFWMMAVIDLIIGTPEYPASRGKDKL